MRSKVMIVVKRLHWCCVSCHMVNKHTVSIDEHLKSCHLDLISLSSETSPCPSDLELDDFGEGDLGLCSESDKNLKKTTKEELSEITPGPDLCSESSEKTGELSENIPSMYCCSVSNEKTTEGEPSEITPSLDLCSESEERTAKGKLSEITPSVDLCSGLYEKTIRGKLCEITPSPFSIKTKETVHCERNETSTSSHTKSKPSNLSKSPVLIPNTSENSQHRMRTRTMANIPVNVPKSEENTNSKNEVRTRNLPNSSVDTPDTHAARLELCSESCEMTIKGELCEITPSPFSIKTKETVHHERSETTSSHSRSKTSNLSKSPVDRPDTFENSCLRMRTRNVSKIPVNMSKSEENTNSRSKVRIRNLPNSSVGMPETRSKEMVHYSHPQKSRQSACKMTVTVDWKENQRHQDSSSVSNTGEPNSGKAREQQKQEHRPHRKRQRPQLISCNKDVHKKQKHSTNNDQSEAQVTRISKEKFKSPGVNSDMDSEASTWKKTKRDYPENSEKSEIFRNELKAVDKEIRKYWWAGKAVKRCRRIVAITEKEMKHVKLNYLGTEQFRNFNDTKTATHLPPVEVNCKQQIAVENAHTVLDSDAMKSDFQYPALDKSLVTMAGTTVTDASETDTRNMNASHLPEEVCNSLSVVPFQTCSETVPSFHQDIQQSCIGNNANKEHEIVPQTLSIDNISQTPSAVCESECPPRQCPSTSSHETPLAVSTILVPTDTDKSGAQNTDDSFKNTPQTDSVCGQQDAFKISKTVKSEHSSFETDGKSSETDPEELVKDFSFSKETAATSFEQPPKVHECSVCQAKFSTSENLSDHIVKMFNHDLSECQNCQRLFHNAYDLNFHVFEDHERRSEPFCFDCGEKFQNLATLDKHLYQHKNMCDPKLLDMKYHSCYICKTDITCRYEPLRMHYSTKHKMSVCTVCYAKSKLVLLPDTASVREHRTTHSNFCKGCFQDFPSVEALNDHYPCQSDCVRQEDGQGKLCGRCSQWCPNKASVTLHIKEHKQQAAHKRHLEKGRNPVPCIYCDKVLYNRRNLERHIDQQHSSCRIYKFHCEYCGKGMDFRNMLNDHIAIHHHGIKRHSCEYCDQCFTFPNVLKRHILKEHATDKQYKCEVCGERFCEKFKLSRHMYVHTGSSRFVCEQCGKACHTSSAFKRHLTVHEEKRGFVCQRCGLGYKRRDHLTRHAHTCTGAMQKAQAGSGENKIENDKK